RLRPRADQSGPGPGFLARPARAGPSGREVREGGRDAMKRSRPRLLEALEERIVPAVFGVPWPDAGHLTFSFGPAGTPAGPAQSELVRLLDGGNSAWKMDVLAALQTWVRNADINLGLVADDGSPLGAAGIVQGDPRFGDIRIAAFPMSDVLAVASP